MTRRSTGRPPLVAICCSRTASALEEVRSRLGRGEDARARGEEGLTPLHVAAAYDNLAICQLLLHYGADPFAKDDIGRTPVHMATGTAKSFLREHVKKDGRTRRRVLRRIFLCHAPSIPRRESRSFFTGIKKRFQRSIGMFTGRDRTSITHPQLDESSSNAVTAASQPQKTPRRRARTPDILQSVPKSVRIDRRSKTPDFDPSVNRNRAPRTPRVPPSADSSARTPLTTRNAASSQPSRYIRKPRSRPTAPPLSPEPATPRTRSKSRDRVSDSSTYLTADESLHMQQLEERLSELRINTPSTPCVDESKLRRIKRLKDTELRAELKTHGIHPGPICSRTRRMYEKKLLHVIEGRVETTGTVYSRQLELAFRGKLDMSQGKTLDEAIRGEFQHGGVTAFVYLLLDPRILGDVSKSDFKLFVKSIFYIGKGTKARPLAHLIDAKKMRNIKSPKLETNAKLQRIDEIWRTGHGVVLLEISHTIGDHEAFVREAAFLEAVRIENLTNVKGGEWHGKSREWDAVTRATFGVYLLHQAMGVCKTIGSRQVYADALPDSLYPNVTVRKR